MVLTNHRGHGGSQQRQVEDLSDGLSVVSFAQQPGRRRGKARCFCCNQEGHVAKDFTAIIDGPESKRVDLMTMTALEVVVERVLTFHKLVRRMSSSQRR